MSYSRIEKSARWPWGPWELGSITEQRRKTKSHTFNRGKKVLMLTTTLPSTCIMFNSYICFFKIPVVSPICQ